MDFRGDWDLDLPRAYELRLDLSMTHKSWEMSMDSREGFATRLKKLEELGFVFVDWGGSDIRPFFKDTKYDIYNMAISRQSQDERYRQFVQNSPVWVNDFITAIPDLKPSWLDKVDKRYWE